MDAWAWMDVKAWICRGVDGVFAAFWHICTAYKNHAMYGPLQAKFVAHRANLSVAHAIMPLHLGWLQGSKATITELSYCSQN